ncbi:MAG: hypothetical protein AUJ52_07875 [Elusimicrobia bacterium CG1_02_63_36]|nr:MAG: hypothetical protein AUJ52_07875 [Elusimicrobia bacterium CG1_02_63_36]PIP82907.1 MAG: hypothetical protein COR54_12460 [Elusimicrobia bacterium CG22_combo_CG10-13_8_21_14_all_63_91]PJA15923.1 MAG: hypothetical protein COX66_08795 [Elusimicrobia bacterium CG_4_10_14_0_2_um_filter_63_34]PJB25013.1 MAG: hypothetical protein CO113_10970 [Elusimicrobia bacterium CG_4_9_14_3_um_filter_62_55]
MKKIIVATTINQPTEAIRKFDALDGWELIVIGDKKTPKDYALERGTYAGPEAQEAFAKPLSDALGWNLVQRRNIGYLMAYDRGADVIATVDDDNIPYDFWGAEPLVGGPATVRRYACDLPAFDPLGATEYRHLWHRGYPVQLLHRRRYDVFEDGFLIPRVDAEAGFWDGDPDVDALCRMEHRPDCSFDRKGFPFAADAWAPFDSQNTLLSRESLKDYFLFPFVGRMDDIWGAYFYQARGHAVVFNRASVRQDRNEHDLTRDLMLEVLGYEKNLALLEALGVDAERIYDFIPPESAKAFDLYRKHF